MLPHPNLRAKSKLANRILLAVRLPRSKVILRTTAEKSFSTVMTAHALKVYIPIQPNMLQSLQQKQGLNEYWKQEFG